MHLWLPYPLPGAHTYFELVKLQVQLSDVPVDNGVAVFGDLNLLTGVLRHFAVLLLDLKYMFYMDNKISGSNVM